MKFDDIFFSHLHAIMWRSPAVSFVCSVTIGSASSNLACMHSICLGSRFTSPAQGREREWLFAEAEGQWEVARQCGARRLVLVALGRGHAFASLAAVQAELSPLVRPLPARPQGCGNLGIGFAVRQHRLGSCGRAVAAGGAPFLQGLRVAAIWE